MHDIRRAVLFAPDRHAVAYDEDHPDDRMEGNTPFLFCENDEPVGVARVDAHGEIGIVRLVAIVANRQRAASGAPWMLFWSPRPGVAASASCVSRRRPMPSDFTRKPAGASSLNTAELTGMARDAVQMQKAIGS